MSKLSRFFKKIVPKTKEGGTTFARKTIARGIKAARKKQHAGEGPNVRKTLLGDVKRDRVASRKLSGKGKLKRAYTKSMAAGHAPKKMGFKHLVSAGGKVRSPRKASLLQTKSYTASR